MAKRPRPKLVRLPQPLADTHMAEALLDLLREVRKGRVTALAICLVVEERDGTEATHYAATADGDEPREVLLLGALSMAQHDLMQRRIEREGETTA